MPVSAFTEDIANNIYRAANVGVRQAGTTDDFNNLGTVKNPKVEYTRVTTGAGTDGRVKELSMDVEVSVELMQTANAEMAVIDELANQLLDVVFTATPQSGNTMSAGIADANLPTLSATGFLAQDVIGHVEPVFDFNGEDSHVVFTVQFRVLTSDFDVSET